MIFKFEFLGDSANAVPYYQKLCTQLTTFGVIASAMEGPRSGGPASLVTDSNVPSTYERSGQVRYWSLTSLSITRMISYKCRQQARGGIRLCARIQLCKVEDLRNIDRKE